MGGVQLETGDPIVAFWASFTADEANLTYRVAESIQSNTATLFFFFFIMRLYPAPQVLEGSGRPPFCSTLGHSMNKVPSSLATI